MEDEVTRRQKADLLLAYYEAAALAHQLAEDFQLRVDAIASLHLALRDGGFRRWREILHGARGASLAPDLVKHDAKLQAALNLATLGELSEELEKAYDRRDQLRQSKLKLGLQ